MAVDFQEVSDGTVTAFLVSEEGYEIFNAVGVIFNAAEVARGPDGTLETGVPSAGTYYLVFTHGPGYETEAQEVRFEYTFTGLQPPSPDWTAVGTGAALLAAGILAAGFAAQARLRSAEGETPEPVS